jgi:predicted membrane protein
MGAGEIIANLADLNPTSVDVKIGAGHLSLVLPSGGDLNVTISIGVGAAEISVPADASISVECTTGIGTCNLPNGSGFWNQSYTSPGYDTAKFQIKIAISMGVGQAKVTQ